MSHLCIVPTQCNPHDGCFYGRSGRLIQCDEACRLKVDFDRVLELSNASDEVRASIRGELEYFSWFPVERQVYDPLPDVPEGSLTEAQCYAVEAIWQFVPELRPREDDLIVLTPAQLEQALRRMGWRPPSESPEGIAQREADRKAVVIDEMITSRREAQQNSFIHHLARTVSCPHASRTPVGAFYGVPVERCDKCKKPMFVDYSTAEQPGGA